MFSVFFARLRHHTLYVQPSVHINMAIIDTPAVGKATSRMFPVNQ